MLSNQAKWYMNGHFPVYDSETYPGARNRPEPKAMAELVKAGLISESKDILGLKMWLLTEEGRKFVKGEHPLYIK